MRSFSIIALLAVVCCVSGTNAPAAEPTVDYIVSFHDGIGKAGREVWVREHGGELMHDFRTGNAVWVRLPAGRATSAATMMADARVAGVEADAVGIPDLVPDDPWYPNQPHFRYTAYPDIDIQAEPAWDIRHDAPEVTVAIIDDGFLLNHPDLAGRFVPGYDCANNDSDPSPDNDGQYFAHGTGVAGLLAAIGNNGIGVAGVCWDVRVMPFKHHNDWWSTYSTLPATLAAVDRAVTAGVDMIVCSFHYLGAGVDVSPTSQFYRSFRAASDAGIIVVASAGNDGKDLDDPANARYPASFDFENVVTVAMVGVNGVVMPQVSAYGNETVEISAPGVATYSTWVDSARQPTYWPVSGTSASAPIVAGAIALVKAAHPELSYPGEVLAHLYQRAETSVANAEFVIDGRRLNLYRSLAEPDLTPPDAVGALAVTSLTNRSVTLRWTEPGDDGATGLLDHFALEYTVEGAPTIAVMDLPSPAGVGTMHSATIDGLAQGSHIDFSVTAVDEFRNRTSAPVAVVLPRPMVVADQQSAFFMARTGACRDSTLVFRNSGDWEGVLTPYLFSGEDWLTFAPDPLHVAPGDSVALGYSCDVSGLCAGFYTAQLGVTGTISAAFTVSLLVLDAPEIAIAPADLNFGEVTAGTTLSLPLTITNRGCADLNWSATIEPDGAGALRPAMGVLAPGASTEALVRILADGPGPARIVVASNDPFDAAAVATVHWGVGLPMIALDGRPVPFGEPVWESFPNPLNPRTTVRYSLREAGDAELRIFDVRGAVVRIIPLGVQGPGVGSADWDGVDNAGRNLPSGAYFCRLVQSGRPVYPALKLNLVR